MRVSKNDTDELPILKKRMSMCRERVRFVIDLIL